MEKINCSYLEDTKLHDLQLCCMIWQLALNFPENDNIYFECIELFISTLFIRGYLDWLKVWMLTLKPEYFLMILWVSSSVLKLFMRTRGTLAEYFLLRNSICCTVRSRKVRSERTGITDLGPL